MRKHWTFHSVIGIGYATLAVSVGCGEYGKQPRHSVNAPGGMESPNQPNNPQSSPNAMPEHNPHSETATNAPAPHQPAGVSRTDKRGRKWIGDIPYDIWFDDPLAVAGKGSELVGDSPMKTDSQSASLSHKSTDARSAAEKGEPPQTSREASPSEGSSATTDWKKLISGDELDGEMKTVRNQLSASLQSTGRYNAAVEDVQISGSTLAAIAAIAADHPDNIRWKPVALSLRDLGTKLEKAAQGTGAKPYEEVRKLFDSLVGLLDGNPPAGFENATNRLGFAECVDRGNAMKRIDRSFQWLIKEVKSANELKDSDAKAIHESSLMATLAQVIAATDFPSADEPEYAAQAKGLVENARRMTQEAKQGNFAEFSAARGLVQKNCNECHTKYRF